jgi:hypothetical protein
MFTTRPGEEVAGDTLAEDGSLKDMIRNRPVSAVARMGGEILGSPHQRASV